MLKFLYILNLLYCMASAVSYKTYQAEPATEQELAEYTKKNNDDICISTFDPCVEDEWRRLNGSCNNLDHPSLGTYHTPIWRMLDAHYSEGYEPRKTKSGKDFPLARYLRRFLLLVGETMNQVIAQSATYFVEFSFLDVGSIHDIELYILHKTHCCEKEGQCDRECVPNYIPYDDSTHRFSDIKCFNMTRPMSFQQKGCVSDGSVPMRLNYATAFLDLSNIYYHVAESDKINRAFEGGFLKVEIVNGRIYPSDANETTTCFIKDAVETGCTRTVPNGLIGTNLCTTWFWRMHNHIARGLAAVNPHWSDEQLYHTARDINIAYYSQILFYEFFALMLGKENLVREGVLGRRNGFRDPYRKNVLPGIALEYSYILRWFHLTQDTQQRMYDKHDNYVNTFPVLNVTLRVQDLTIGDNMIGLTHGSYIQPAGGFDQVAHPEMVEVGLGHHLAKAFDILSADLSRGRYFGIAPYTKYRDMCTGYKIRHEKFEDLRYLMSDTKIDELKKMYEHPDDIEFFAGVWAEDLMNGTWVTPTVYSLILKQLQRSVASDRHWYERPNRPHAFNQQQLKQIRQASFAGLLCTVGDDVTKIQPRAFEKIRHGNYKVSCDKIPQLDFEVWREERRGGRSSDC